MTTKPTARQVEEVAMIHAWLTEASVELASRGQPLVEAIMRSSVDESFEGLAHILGVQRAVAMFATVAFEARRKAERAGLAHETPGDAR